MVAFDVYDKNKTVTEKVELSESVFSAPVNDIFLHQVMVSYRANQRQGTHASKSRSMVSGTRKKPFRQKGTGRARQGCAQAAHLRGGAAQFGPQPRSYRKTITKQMKKRAFIQTLSLKAVKENFFILSDLEFEDRKTKLAANVLKAFDVTGRTLFLDVDPSDNTFLAIRNIAKVEVKSVNECSPLDIFSCDNLFITKAAAEAFQQRYS
jgi:large subunit ribosomal protein L4